MDKVNGHPWAQAPDARPGQRARARRARQGRFAGAGWVSLGVGWVSAPRFAGAGWVSPGVGWVNAPRLGNGRWYNAAPGVRASRPGPAPSSLKKTPPAPLRGHKAVRLLSDQVTAIAIEIQYTAILTEVSKLVDITANSNSKQQAGGCFPILFGFPTQPRDSGFTVAGPCALGSWGLQI